MKKSYIVKLITAVALIVMYCISPLQNGFATQQVTIQILGKEQRIQSAQRVYAKTVHEALVTILDARQLPYEMKGSEDNPYLFSIQGEQNWLYQVNGWTPSCTPMGAYQLKGGDHIDIYQASHAYTTKTKLSAKMQTLQQGESWEIQAQTQQWNAERQCEKPVMHPWKQGQGIVVTVKNPSGTTSTHTTAITGVLNIETSEQGWYRAWIWTGGYFPSQPITQYVREKESVQVPAEESQQKQEEQDKKQEEKQQNQQQEEQEQQSDEEKKITENKKKQEKVSQPATEKETEKETAKETTDSEQKKTETSSQDTNKKEEEKQEQAVASKTAQDKAVEAAVNALIKNRDQQGRIANDGIHTWATIAALAALGKDHQTTKELVKTQEEVIEKVSDLSIYDAEKNIIIAKTAGISSENFGGANVEERFYRYFDGQQFGEKEAINDDIWAIIAMRTLGVENSSVHIRQTRNYIREHQNEDGGFSAIVSQKSDIDTTASAIMALYSAGFPKEDQVVQKAITFIQNQEIKEEKGFPHQPGEKEINTVSTAWAAQALYAIGAKDVQEYKTTLLEMQKEDGTVRTTKTQEGDTLFATALVLPAMAGKIFPLNQTPAPIEAKKTEQEQTLLATTGQAGDNKEDLEKNNTDNKEEQQAVMDDNSKEEKTESATRTEKEASEMLYQKEQEVLRIRRANIILITTVIVMSIGIVLYTIIMHTNILRNTQFFKK